MHFILDNYATHEHARVKAGWTGTPRVHFHFVPTSASWLNLVERGLALRRLSPSGEVLDTIATIDWSDNAVEYERDPGRLWPALHPLTELPPIGLQEYLTALRPDGSAIVQIGRVDESGTPPTFDILAISISGDTLVQRAVEYEPREVTSAMERRLAEETAGWRAAGGGWNGRDDLVASRDARGPCRCLGNLRFGRDSRGHGRGWTGAKFPEAVDSSSRYRPREP